MLATLARMLPGTQTDQPDPFRLLEATETQELVSRESKPPPDIGVPAPKVERRTPSEILKSRRDPKRNAPARDLPPTEHTPWRDCHHLKIDPREAEFRHSHWKSQRLAVAYCLHARNPAGREYYLFRNCGADATLLREQETGDWRIQSCTCKHRMCQPCRRRTAATVQMNLEAHCHARMMKNRNTSLRAITLTWKHEERPLKHQIRDLFKCFATLRRRKAVKGLFDGGSFVLEVKVSSHDHKWHPHLHIITEGTYVNVYELSAAWEAVTKHSFKVWVKAIHNVKEAVAHDTKYITKATDNSVFENQRKLAEYIDATRGVRAYGTFGSWRGLELTKRKPDTGIWLSTGPLTQLLNMVADKDPHSIAVLNYLKTRNCDYEAPPAAESS